MEWLNWFVGTVRSRFKSHPAPGTKLHRELRMRARREFKEERFKPAEQRDPDRLRQLRIQGLKLGIEQAQVKALLARLAMPFVLAPSMPHHLFCMIRPNAIRSLLYSFVLKILVARPLISRTLLLEQRAAREQ